MRGASPPSPCRIQKSMLLDLNKEIMNELGVTVVGDIIAILKHAKVVHRQVGALPCPNFLGKCGDGAGCEEAGGRPGSQGRCGIGQFVPLLGALFPVSPMQ